MSRAQVRLVLVIAGIVPTLVALAFAAKVVTMLSHDRDGRDRFDDTDYSAAAGEFGANDRLNWFESWVSPFDEGASRHADGDLDTALELYAQALEDVPQEEECTVRINAALAHETLGDTAAADGDPDEAIAQWQAGIDVLAEGACPTDSGRGEAQTADAAAVDERLRNKQSEQQQQQQDQNQDEQDEQDQQDQQTPEEQQEQRERERKERKLEERNDEGIEEQQEHEDSQRERDYSQYHW